MKNSSNNPALAAASARCRLALAVLSKSIYPAIALLCAFDVGQSKAAEACSFTFPPKPAGLTNCPTISQPEIEFSPTLTEKLGGQDTTNLLVPRVAHLLSQTERFRLTHGSKARCRCLVRLTDLEIRPTTAKDKIDVGQVSQALGGLFKKKNSGIPSSFTDLSTNINWSSEKAQVSVRCEVSVEIIDAANGVVLAEETGEETRTNTAKAIGLVLGSVYAKESVAGPSAGVTTPASSAAADYKVSLVQLAAQRAICKFLPNLDKKLLTLVDEPVAGKEITDVGSSSFCRTCGKPVGSEDKFCAYCGGKLRK